MNVREDCIIFLIWLAWVLFNFYLEQKHRFSVCGFPEDSTFISFYVGIWPRYSEINEFKIIKDFSFQKMTKTLKIQASKITLSTTRLFALLDIHCHNSLNTELEKQNKT